MKSIYEIFSQKINKSIADINKNHSIFLSPEVAFFLSQLWERRDAFDILQTILREYCHLQWYFSVWKQKRGTENY